MLAKSDAAVQTRAYPSVLGMWEGGLGHLVIAVSSL